MSNNFQESHDFNWIFAFFPSFLIVSFFFYYIFFSLKFNSSQNTTDLCFSASLISRELQNHDLTHNTTTTTTALGIVFKCTKRENQNRDLPHSLITYRHTIALLWDMRKFEFYFRVFFLFAVGLTSTSRYFKKPHSLQFSTKWSHSFLCVYCLFTFSQTVKLLAYMISDDFSILFKTSHILHFIDFRANFWFLISNWNSIYLWIFHPGSQMEESMNH